MSSPQRYVCTLCNVEFPWTGEDGPRCPHCLRRTGVVPSTAPPASHPLAWRPSRPFLLGLGAAVLAVALAVAAWFIVPLLRPTEDADSLEEALIAAGMPVPWGDLDAVETAATSLASLPPAEAASGLAAACYDREGVRLIRPDENPEGFRTGSEVATLTQGAITRVEAAACLLALARAAGLSAVPCAPTSPPPASAPAWDRPVGVCLTDGSARTVVAPGANDENLDSWQPLPLSGFAAIYLAAAAEAAGTQAQVYALFRQARTLWEDPTFLFRLGATKARLGVKEFAIEDMRQALAAGAGVDGNLLLADTLLEVGQAAEAVQTYDRAGGDDPRGQLGKARAYLVLDLPDKAGSELVPLAKDHPDMEGVLETLASWKLRTGDLDAAAEAIDQAIARKPRPDHYLMLDDLLAQKGKTADSLPRLAAGYDTTHDLRVGERLLQRQIELERKEDAVLLSARMLQDHPDDHKARWLRFEALLAAGRMKEADNEATPLLAEKQPHRGRSALVAAAIARLSLEAGGEKGNRPALEAVRQLASFGPRGIHAVSRWFEEHGSPDLAQQALVLALEARPADEELTNHLYLLYGLHGRAEQARKLRDQALAGLEGDARDAREDQLDRIDRYLKTTRSK